MGQRARRPRVLFLGRTYAGHRTRFANLQAHAGRSPLIQPTFREVSGWVDGGWIERMPVPTSLRGRLRATVQASALASLPRPDVIWTSVTEVATPHLWSEVGALRRPLVLDLDWTFEQQEALAPAYFGRRPKRGVRRLLGRLVERALWSSTTLFTPWSNWAAASLRKQGIPDERIRVIPPGVDLDAWRPRSVPRPASDDQLRLVFVGGDFERKGGSLLLDVLQSRFSSQCHLDVVTSAEVPPVPGVRVHRAEPNSPVLRQLYAQGDVFVMPTRADCFGIASVEAMASGLPVITSDVGGARDIVDHDETGWLIQPTAHDLAAAIENALDRRSRLAEMGRRARQVAEKRFDGRRNDEVLVDLLVEQAAQPRRA